MKPGQLGECETEYRRRYRDSKFGCFTKNYQSNLDFRIYQKGRFQRHIREPFQWDIEEWYDSDTDLSCDDHDDPTHVCTSSAHTLRAGVPLYKYKHDKLNEMYRNRLKREITASEMRSNKQRFSDLRLDSGDERDRRGSKGRRQNGTASDGEDSGAGGSDADSEVHIVESDRVRRERHLRGRSRTENGDVGGRDIYLHFSDDEDANNADKYHRRSHTNTRSPTGRRYRVATDPGPFLPYGHDNDVKEVGKKKTHNVRASDEIHPSALRAQYRHREQQNINDLNRSRLRSANFLSAHNRGLSRSATIGGGHKGSSGGHHHHHHHQQRHHREGGSSEHHRRDNGLSEADGIVGPSGMTVDSRGRTVPWQRGGSHSPYIPDGTGTKGWASEYEREFQPRRAGNKSEDEDANHGGQAGGKVCYDGQKRVSTADRAFYGLSYGRRLRDEGILPST